MDNTTTVVGNLTKDPVLNQTKTGVAVANLAIAVNRRVRNSDTGQYEDALDGYFDVVIWRDYAENVAKSLSKGDRVIVTGRITKRSYPDKNGATQWVTEIQADESAHAAPLYPSFAAYGGSHPGLHSDTRPQEGRLIPGPGGSVHHGGDRGGGPATRRGPPRRGCRHTHPGRSSQRRCRPAAGQSPPDGGMKADDAKKLKDLEVGNARLKKLLAEAELDKSMLKELAEGKW